MSSETRMMAKRIFDFLMAAIGVILLFPVLVLVGVIVATDSNGGVFYRQWRTGKGGKPFLLWKFRTMKTHADRDGLLTIGGNDRRVTRVGVYLRKYKLDELPQLFNVVAGEMSLVGPRPEVSIYTDLYTEQQRAVLTVRPGITDYASIAYRNENELLSLSNDPEHTYIHDIMPAKLALNLRYIRERTFAGDIKIILETILKIVKG